MQASNSFKKSFMKHMMLGLQLGGGGSSKSMSFIERMRAIKLSADISLAIAGGGSNWSRSLLTSLSKQEKSKALVRSIMGKAYERITKPCFTLHTMRSKKILRRSFQMRSPTRSGARASHAVAASALARGMMKKRNRILRGLVPGGEALDEFSLLGETIDYVVALRAQIDLMRLLARANDDLNLKACTKGGLQEREASCIGK